MINGLAVLQSKEERQQRALEAQQRRVRRRMEAGTEDELEWERYGKYDMFHELLQAASSAPSLQVKALLNSQSPRQTPDIRSLRAHPSIGETQALFTWASVCRYAHFHFFGALQRETLHPSADILMSDHPSRGSVS